MNFGQPSTRMTALRPKVIRVVLGNNPLARIIGSILESFSMIVLIPQKLGEHLIFSFFFLLC